MEEKKRPEEGDGDTDQDAKEHAYLAALQHQREQEYQADNPDTTQDDLIRQYQRQMPRAGRDDRDMEPEDTSDIESEGAF